MPIATFALVAIDCPEPRALAEFYQQIVGGEIQQNNTHGDWVRLATPDGSDIGFQRARDHQPPGWPSGTPQQLHLDFDVNDLDQGEHAVLAIGARKADFQPEPDDWRVFLDPAGHPFCLVLA